MKKLSCILIAVVLMLTSTSGIGEEFSLHNGSTFGMTKEEVVELESNAGITFEESTSGNNFFPSNLPRLEATTYAAGREGTSVYYLFNKNEKVNSLLYISSDFMQEPIENDDVLNTLNEKYGKPATEGDKCIAFNGEAYASLDVYTNYTRRYPTENVKITLFSQWLYPYDEGRIDIQIMMLDVGYGLHYRIISYSYRTPEEINTMAEEAEQMAEDLNSDL